MTTELLLYTRKDCGLCGEMKEVLCQFAKRYPVMIREIDVDDSPELQEKYGSEVPVLFVNGRKAFKYRLTSSELEKKLRNKRRWWL